MLLAKTNEDRTTSCKALFYGYRSNGCSIGFPAYTPSVPTEVTDILVTRYTSY